MFALCPTGSTPSVGSIVNDVGIKLSNSSSTGFSSSALPPFAAAFGAAFAFGSGLVSDGGGASVENFCKFFFFFVS